MKQVIAGISGVASLAFLGYIASRNQHSIKRRSIAFDDELEIEEVSYSANQTEEWIQFFKDIHLDVDQDVLEKTSQVDYTGNYANMKQFRGNQYANVHSAMLMENIRRMTDAGEWADAMKPNMQQAAEYKPAAGESGNCEWSSSVDRADEDGCALRKGLTDTSPHVASVLQKAGCDDESYIPFSGYTNDQGNFVSDGADNTNIWFIVPRAIPLWAKDESSHVSDWVEYFNFIRSVTEKWFVRKHNGVVRLSVGLYLNGVQMIPRGVKMDKRNPLARLNRWYSQPSINAQKPGFFRTFQSISQNIGRGVYAKNSGNGLLDGSSEARDNCYLLMFIQDIPYDLNAIHIRTDGGSKQRTGDFFDTINSVCTANYAFVMPGASNPASPAGKFIDQFELIAFPSRTQYYPWDPEYSGIYRLENFQQVSSPEFESHVRASMCMLSKRQQCKLSMKGNEITPTVADYEADYYGSDQYSDAYAEYASNAEVEYTDDAQLDDSYYELKSITEAPEEVAPQPECCGGNVYGGNFNNVEKQCIYDFETNSIKIVSRDHDAGSNNNYSYDSNYDYSYRK